jgi:hypothetical protein
MNTCAIHKMVPEPQIRVMFFLSSPIDLQVALAACQVFFLINLHLDCSRCELLSCCLFSSRHHHRFWCVWARHHCLSGAAVDSHRCHQTCYASTQCHRHPLLSRLLCLSSGFVTAVWDRLPPGFIAAATAGPANPRATVTPASPHDAENLLPLLLLFRFDQNTI